MFNFWKKKPCGLIARTNEILKTLIFFIIVFFLSGV